MKVLIERCEVTVPRRGQQEKRKRLQERCRKADAEAAADWESQPWYIDPDGPYGGDDTLTIHYEWSVPNGGIKCSQSFVPLHLAGLLREFSCGPVERHTKAEDPICEYTFPLTASFAISTLQHHGILPPDVEMANETDIPVCCEEADAA
jgi:hypothetical protein